MAVCAYCQQDMLTADGCTYKRIKIGNRPKDRITLRRQKVGDEGWYHEGDRCGDCNALFGHYHHPGCDIERCPLCGGQLASCDCVFVTYLK